MMKICKGPKNKRSKVYATNAHALPLC